MAQLHELPYVIDQNFALSNAILRSFLPMEAIDENGRTLLEGRSLLHKPAANDYQVCPFPDTRYQHSKPMNIGALKYLTAHNSKAISYFRTLSSKVDELAYTNIPTQSVKHLARLGHVALKAPQIWLLNGYLRSDQERVPVEVAIAAKLAQGLIDLSSSSTQTKSPQLDTLTGENLYQYLDANKMLIGRAEVCAGPPNIIRHYLTAAVDPHENVSPETSYNYRSICNYTNLILLAEIVALLYNYARMSALNMLNGKLSVENDLRVSYPNALKLFHIVQKNLSFSKTELWVYVDILWFTEQTRECEPAISAVIASIGQLLRENPSDFVINPEQWLDIVRNTLEAFSVISRKIDEIGIIPNSTVDFTQELLEVAFGRAPFSISSVI
ncbi:hypothetical protein [Rhizobium rhizogenes]|uniref:hypothetical protein n=1 Tax=Rhizobium rhizogenes TaxID=359 RepID=UPI001572DA99|nr:hypothetical protein [Rhizobium rhizogenes]NTF98075.1 hypothetical protein [Rhizobium rhizogenes]